MGFPHYIGQPLHNMWKILITFVERIIVLRPRVSFPRHFLLVMLYVDWHVWKAANEHPAWVIKKE